MNPSSLILINAVLACRTGFRIVLIAWLSLTLRNQPGDVGLILLFSSMVVLIFARQLGHLLDVFQRKKSLFLTSEAVIAVLGTLFPLVFKFDNHTATIASFLVILFFIICAENISATASVFFLKNLVAKNKQALFINKNSFFSQTAMIVGTGLGGFWLDYASTAWLFVPLTAGGLICIAVIAISVPDTAFPIETCTSAHRNDPYFFRPAEAFPAGLTPIIFMGALVYSIGQVTNTLLPGLVFQSLKQGSASYATIEIAWAAGAMTASLLCMLFRSHATDKPFYAETLIVLLMSSALVFMPWIVTAGAFSALLGLHMMLGAGFSFVRMRNQYTMLRCCPATRVGACYARLTRTTGIFGMVIYLLPTLLRGQSVATLYVETGSLLFAMTALFFVIQFRQWKRIGRV